MIENDKHIILDLFPDQNRKLSFFKHIILELFPDHFCLAFSFSSPLTTICFYTFLTLNSNNNNNNKKKEH